MDIRISSRHADLGARFREMVEEKLSRALNVDDTVAVVDLVVTEQPGRNQDSRFRLEVSSGVHGRHVRVVSEAATPEEALDDAARRFSRQVSRLKERLVDGSRKGSTPSAADLEHDLSGEVVRVKRFVMKPMSIEEATLQMEMLGHAFFFFVNAASDRHSVLYRRADGHLGLIEAS